MKAWMGFMQEMLEETVPQGSRYHPGPEKSEGGTVTETENHSMEKGLGRM